MNKFSKAVKFHPYVGEHYEKGRYNGRLLILGESHYCGEGEDTFNLNINCVKAIADGSWKNKYWTIISRAVLNLRNQEIDRESFWNAVAFYNFVQYRVGNKSRQRPTRQMWKNSIPAFEEVLKKLQPRNVIVFGTELWRAIPKSEKPKLIGEGKYCSEYANYEIDESVFRLMGLPHPSSPKYFGKIEDRAEVVQRWLNL